MDFKVYFSGWRKLPSIFLYLCSLAAFSVQWVVGFQEVPRAAFVAWFCSLSFSSLADDAFYSTIS